MPARIGESKPHYSPDEQAAIVEKVCQYYESQQCTIESAAEAAGISYRVFKLWTAKNSDFAERYKKARIQQDDDFWMNIIRPKNKTGIERLVTGERAIERKIKKEMKKNEEGEFEFVETEETITDREILPNATVTIFVAKGIFPDRFADRTKNEHEVNVNDTSWFGELPLESRLEILKIRNAARKPTADRNAGSVDDTGGN